MSETKLTISQCKSCRQSHELITLSPLAVEQEPYTHWFRCPVTDDPVLTTVKPINGEHVLMNPDIMHYLGVAHSYGRYIVAIAHLVPPKTLTVSFVTQNYPNADFEPFLRKLREDYWSKTDEGLPDENPQPYAGKLTPLQDVNLFDGGD